MLSLRARLLLGGLLPKGTEPAASTPTSWSGCSLPRLAGVVLGASGGVSSDESPRPSPTALGADMGVRSDGRPVGGGLGGGSIGDCLLEEDDGAAGSVYLLPKALPPAPSAPGPSMP